MLPENPVTRQEMYLNRIATGSGTLPEKPITREEMYLDAIAKNGGGGGGGSDNNFTDEYKEKLDEIEAGAQVNVNADWDATEGDAEILNKPDIDGMQDQIDYLYELIENAKVARYGVSGVGQAASTLTRTFDSVGMSAQVGTDGDNSSVVNDFDNAYPFKRRKCVGNWTLEDGRAKFTVNAYYGDADYTEDGTMGDYVAVECPLCYYSFENGNLVVSGYKYDGYRAFDIFCRDHDQNQTLEKIYLPAYALALKDGHAVSLPGLDNEQGAYKTLVDACRTYDGDGVEDIAHLEPYAVGFYEWALMTVEFATQNMQSIMYGCANLRSADADTITFIDATHGVASGNYLASRVPGEYVCISTATSHTSATYKATHKIVSCVRCTENGTPDSSGTFNLLELEDLGKNYFTYSTGTAYQLAGRPYRTGACNGVSTPSGSPVDNTSGYYPCRYRWRENPYGNQYHTIADLFNQRIGTGDSDYYLQWYLLLDPSAYTPSTTSKPDATDLATSAFALLDVGTDHSHYVNGYIKSEQRSAEFPDVRIPYETSGGSATTYMCDYAYLVLSLVVRSVRLAGSWFSGASDGPLCVFAYFAPSSASAYYGGDLCFTQ